MPVLIGSSTAIPTGAVTTAKIADANVTAAKLDYATTIKGWEFIETLSPSAVASIASSTIVNATYKYLMLVFRLKPSAADFLRLTLNNDTTANNYKTVSSNVNSTANVTTTDNKFFIASGANMMFGVIYINLIGSGEINNICGDSHSLEAGGNGYGLISGHKITGVNVTTVELFLDSGSGQTMTGKIQVYGMRQ